MAQVNNPEKSKDFAASWVSSSRFLFYLKLAAIVAFFFGACSRLYVQRYKGKPDVEVQSSSKFTPEYK